MAKEKLTKKQQALKDQYYAALAAEKYSLEQMLEAKAILEYRQKELEEAQHQMHMAGHRLEEAGVYF